MHLVHSLEKGRIEALMGLLATKKAVAELAFRLGELDSEVRTLKTANKHLELEWEELYDKVRRQMSRMSKRSAIDAPPLVNDEVVAEPDDGLDPISRSIMLRRGQVRKL